MSSITEEAGSVVKRRLYILISVLTVLLSGMAVSAQGSSCLDEVARRVKVDDTITVLLTDGSILKGIAASVGIDSSLSLVVISNFPSPAHRVVLEGDQIQRISFAVPSRTYSLIGMLAGLALGGTTSGIEDFRISSLVPLNLVAWGVIGGAAGYLLDWRQTMTVEISCSD